jgi:hypothetical protein
MILIHVAFWRYTVCQRISRFPRSANIDSALTICIFTYYLLAAMPALRSVITSRRRGDPVLAELAASAEYAVFKQL